MKFAVLVVILLASVSTSVDAEPTELPSLPGGAARVRAGDGRTAAILRDGLSRSATMRDLVGELEQSDVIVYLEIQWNLRRGLAGNLAWVAATESSRYVRISLSPDLTTDAMVATLGHELQHAVEIAREPSIVSSDTMASYYARNGLDAASHWNGWDTLAARQAGDEVRRELGQQKFQRSAKVPQHPAVTVRS
jgi:hypothetical protein